MELRLDGYNRRSIVPYAAQGLEVELDTARDLHPVRQPCVPRLRVPVVQL